MPPKKRGAKSPARGRGRGKKKAEEEVPEEEMEQQADEEKDTNQNADDSQDIKQDDATEDAEEETSQQEEASSQDESADGEGVNGKRKAEDDEEEEESSNKKAKTEDDEEDDADKPVTLFCGNLDPDLTTETLKGFFETNGVDVTNPRKIGFKRFGYVDVAPDDVERALELNGKELNGEPIRLDKSKPKASQEDSRVQGGDSKTMFVKGLKETVTEDEIKEFFDGVDISEIRLPKKRDGMCKGFGYVVFEDEDVLERIIKEKQGEKMDEDGEPLFLDYTDDKSSHAAGGRNKEFGPSKVLFVRNLAFQVTEDELQDIFDGCKACRIPPNEYGQSKGFGFVEFETQEAAESAKADKDGLEIQGREVQLAFANDKPGGNAGGGGGGFRRGYGGPMRGGRGGGSWGGGRGGGGWGGGGGGWGGRGGGGWGGGGRGGGGWGRGGGGWGGGRGGGGWGGGGRW